MRIRIPDLVIRALAAMALLGIVGGVTLVLTGLISVSASSGHWAITDWFLHFAMRRAVNTQALGIEPPPLDDPALLAQGAGHYEIGCSPCHGRPGAEPPPIPDAMTPPPPYLPPRIAEWESRELFWIVKNGIKFTGMPAWAAQTREDEVWSVVAFLLELPSLDAETYRALAFGELASSSTSDTLAPGAESDGTADNAETALCIRCHGANGEGRGAFPRLAALEVEYLHATLASYASGIRPSGIMQPVAASLDEGSLRRIAEYYAAADVNVATAAADADVDVNVATADAAERDDVEGDASVGSDAEVERGRRIASLGIPNRDIASCAYCHGPDRVAQNPMFPSLAGQPRRYLERQLELWVREDGRGGTEYAHVMYEAAKGLRPDEISDVAAYYARLPAER